MASTDYKADTKAEDLHLESDSQKGAANDFNTEVDTNAFPMTDEQSRAVCRKIDRVILPILMWVYFLQILDKSVVGYGAVLGLREDAGLVGNHYSIIGSAGYWAQLAWQPFSAIVMVKVPVRYLMSFLVTAWGISTVGLACSTSYGPLLACRFLLGLFEASCLPLFAMVTATWYRRQEQPLRVALWYGTNGLASILGSLLAYCCSFIKGGPLYIYQVLFLIVGIVTVLTGPYIYLKLDNGPATARFLNEEERSIACQRVAQNSGGTESTNVNWPQIIEALWSPITWAFVTLAFTNNTGASVSNVFGPIIIRSLGFSGKNTLLLNVPFGTLQTIVIVVACAAAVKWRYKSIALASLSLPCIIGSALLYTLPRNTKAQQVGNLISYYLLAFLFAGNPLIVSWLVANTGGHSKRSAVVSLYNAGASVGNIVGPLLFKAVDAPRYQPGLRAVMGLFIAQAGLIGFMVFGLIALNKRNSRKRVAVGKPAVIVDRSMQKKIEQHVENVDLEAIHESQKGAAPLTNANKDISDLKNDEFVYVL